MNEPDSLELSEFQARIAEIVETMPAPARHAARSAVRHVQRAWGLRTIDPEMAAFRAITAEEEAATAIFLALKARRYPHAERLKQRDHVHKWAVVPFFEAIVAALSRIAVIAPPQVYIAGDDVRVRVATTTDDGSQKWADAIPPLHFVLANGGKPLDYRGELATIVQEEQVKTIRDHIRELANQRNCILYASSNGVPNLQLPIDGFIRATRDRVFGDLVVYLLIAQHPEHQLYVVECFQVFIEMLRLLPPLLPEFFI